MLTQEKQTVTQSFCLHIVRDTNHAENSCSEESRCSQTPSKLHLNDSLKHFSFLVRFASLVTRLRVFLSSQECLTVATATLANKRV